MTVSDARPSAGGRAGGLRVLHVVHSDRFAGVEQFVKRLALAQAEAGHDVSVIGGSERHLSRPLRDAGASWAPGATLAQVLSETRGRMSSADVVNSHMTDADLAALVARVSVRASPPLVSTRHFAQARGSRGPRRLYRFAEQKLDAEISISRSVAAAVGVSSTVVHPGVHPRAATDTPRLGIVLIAQRLQPEKNTGLGIEAFARSGLAASGWTLELAGTGPEQHDLAKVVERLGLAESVRFLGFKDDLDERMSRSGILLATTPSEGFGLTVLEAMSAGLPIVASGAGGHVEMLEGLDSRALFPPNDIDAAATALRSLAHDPAGRATLGERERVRQASDFSLTGQVTATDRVYHRAIAARTNRRRG